MDIRVKHSNVDINSPGCPEAVRDKLHHLASNPDQYEWEQVGELYATYEEAMAFMQQYAEEYSKRQVAELIKSGVKCGQLSFGGQFAEVDTPDGKLWKVLICKNADARS
jgi:hypothetical protein